MHPLQQPAHVIAVVGGAVSGSVAARRLAERGCEVVVFEQNDRPYGKIEDGLPRWHTKLRQQEYKKIDERLAHERIHFVPRTRLGRDLDFRELVMSYTVPQDLTGTPTCAVRAGFDALGMPVGVQLTGPQWSEARVLRAAQALHAGTPEVQAAWPDLSAATPVPAA